VNKELNKPGHTETDQITADQTRPG